MDVKRRSLEAAIRMLTAGGIDVTDTDRRLLALAIDQTQDSAPFSEYPDAALLGFLRLAADGYEFAGAHQIRERYGNTLRGNYPEASEPFLQFATSYWTLKILATDAAVEQRDLVVTSLLASVEQQIAGLFFPTPGPVRIDPDTREATQRQLLEQSGAALDLETFIRGNPILIRDRAAARPGCAVALLLPALSVFRTLGG